MSLGYRKKCIQILLLQNSVFLMSKLMKRYVEKYQHFFLTTFLKGGIFMWGVLSYLQCITAFIFMQLQYLVKNKNRLPLSLSNMLSFESLSNFLFLTFSSFLFVETVFISRSLPSTPLHVFIEHCDFSILPQLVHSFRIIALHTFSLQTQLDLQSLYNFSISLFFARNASFFSSCSFSNCLLSSAALGSLH